MDRETAIKRVAADFGVYPEDYYRQCLGLLEVYEQHLQISRTTADCWKCYSMRACDSSKILVGLAFRRALEVVEVEEAEKQPVAPDDPFGGLSPTGG